MTYPVVNCEIRERDRIGNKVEYYKLIQNFLLIYVNIINLYHCNINIDV